MLLLGGEVNKIASHPKNNSNHQTFLNAVN